MDLDTQQKSDNLKAICATFNAPLEKLEKDGRILRKSKELSIKAPKAGNDLFTQKGHDSHIHKDILNQYSKSIAFASKGTEEFILGQSNRSILLMHFRRYKEALVDIDTAIKLLKNDVFTTKLQARKEKCSELFDKENLENSVEDLFADKSELDLESFASKLMNFEPSAILPHASSCIDLAYNDKFGRHLVANRDIQTGEILIAEEAYACCPKKSLIYVVCSHCLQIAWNGIPCDDCVFAIYCSEECQIQARKMYHDVECSMLKYMDYIADKMCDRMTAFRILIRAARKEGLECILNEAQKKTEKKDGLDSILSNGILHNDHFKSYYNLLAHAQDFQSENEDDDICTSIMVYLLSEHTDFFRENSTYQVPVKPHMLLSVKDILTKLKHILDTNAFWYQAPLNCSCQTVDECTEICNSSRGVFLTSTCSFFNHSCTLNVSQIYVPKQKVIEFANSPIKQGEQLFDSYGVTYTEDVEVRQRILKHGFGFTCQCIACKDNYKMTGVSDATKEDLKKIMTEYQHYYPETIGNSFFVNPINECQFSEEFLQHVKKISELFFKHLNYYTAIGYNVKCTVYIEKLLLKLYGENHAIPNECVKTTVIMSSKCSSELDEFQAFFAHLRHGLKEIEKSGKLLEKSVRLSNEARKAGNNFYTKDKHESHHEILSNYSKSIVFAPRDSEELALGYSNRSALLMHLHRHKETLVDIERALLLTNSDGLKKKLRARKEKCLELLEEENLAESAKNLSLCGSEDLENLASKLMNFEPSIALPCASKSVGLACNDKFGRHLVATQDIDPGEILIVEQGYVCYPMLNQMYLICSHCLRIAWNGIPCDECAYSIYCSETCKNEAFNEYHDIECPMVKYMDHTVFNNEKNGFDRMATVRLLLKALKNEGLENIMEEIVGRRNEENLDQLLSDGILKSDKFRSFYHLLTHAEEIEKENKNLELNTLVMVYLLIECTKFSNIYKLKENPIHDLTEESDLLLKLKEVLAKLKYITITNGYVFQTTPWQCGCNDIYHCEEKCDRLNKGIVIVPTCSLLNHSCTPNVSHACTPKRKIIIFSTCPIKKGEQLFDNYGMSLINGDSQTRESNLKEFHFTCECEACLEKIDPSMIPTISNSKYLEFLPEFKRCFPEATRNSFFSKSIVDCEVSEQTLKYVIKMSQLYYKHFDYCTAYVHSSKCKAYIKKMMSVLYEEKNAIPKDC